MTPAGLGITKTGKLQVPHVMQTFQLKAPGQNTFGMPYAKVGDWVSCSPNNGFLSLDTIGRVSMIEPTHPTFVGCGAEGDYESCHFISLAGNAKVCWKYAAYVLTEEQVCDFTDSLSPEDKAKVAAFLFAQAASWKIT
jgi:hypothetical protein